MSGQAEAALHPVLIAALKANAAVASFVGTRVLEWASPNEAYPMITMGGYQSAPYDTSDSLGSEITATIHSWAAGAGGRVTARKINVAIGNALHRQALTVPGFKVVNAERVFSDATWDEASEASAKSPLAHGVCVFRFNLQSV